jgi:two-component system, OmpR family, response regulator ArlR
MMAPVKVLIIEDEKQISRFLELELQHEGYSVEISYDGREGLKAAQESPPDILLLDIMLPGMNGMEVCRKIRLFSKVPIIILTAKDETIDKVMGLDLGANDYVTKPFVIEELLARIRALLRKSDPDTKNNKTLTIGNLVMDLSKRDVKRGNESIDLTKREYDLLEYLTRNKGIVLKREQILEHVWGFEYMGDTNVVDVYIRYLRSKIDELYESKLIHTVRGVGYVMKEEKCEG